MNIFESFIPDLVVTMIVVDMEAAVAVTMTEAEGKSRKTVDSIFRHVSLYQR